LYTTPSRSPKAFMMRKRNWTGRARPDRAALKKTPIIYSNADQFRHTSTLVYGLVLTERKHEKPGQDHESNMRDDCADMLLISEIAGRVGGTPIVYCVSRWCL
jgi:hypothetical protein